MPQPERPLAAASLLAPALLQAYRETDYTVCAHPGFVLQVDKYCAQLAAYCAQQGLNSACWLTAWNPCSELLGTAENQARQARLEQQLRQAGWHWLAAIASHPHNGWPPEPGCFIAGMGSDAASDWGAAMARMPSSAAARTRSHAWCCCAEPA